MWSSVTCFFYLAQWLKAGGEGDNKGWDGWMAWATQWTWVWVNAGSWWWSGRPGVMQSMGSPRVTHNWSTELNWTEYVGAIGMHVSSLALWYLLRWVENLWQHINLHVEFAAFVLIISKTWKQPLSPSIIEQTNRLWYIQAIEYYLVLKRNVLLSHAKAWRNFKCILLSERSQSEKDTEGSMIITIWQPRKGKTMVIINRSVVARLDGEEMNRAHSILGQWKFCV